VSFATDANILIYAVHRESEHHAKAKAFIETCMAGPELWTIPWPVIHAFLRIATHTGVFPNPLSPAQATSVIDNLAALPHVQFIGESPGFWNDYKAGILAHQSRGNAVPDTLIAFTLLAYGVTTLYAKDRDFRRYEGLKVIDPLV
jgi:toxin-antitoxin system PIN domain toxin